MTTEEWNDKPAGGPRMTPTTLAAAILRDVTRYRLTGYDAGTQPDGAGPYVSHHEVLSALTSAMDPAIAERAGELARSDDPKVMLYHGEYVEALRSLIAQNAALRAERDELRAAIFGSPDYDPALRNGNFREMAETLHASRAGGVARAEAAEAQIAALTARVEGLTGALQAFKDFDDLPVFAKRPDVFELRVRQPILAALTTEEGHE